MKGTYVFIKDYTVSHYTGGNRKLPIAVVNNFYVGDVIEIKDSYGSLVYIDERPDTNHNINYNFHIFYEGFEGYDREPLKNYLITLAEYREKRIDEIFADSEIPGGNTK